jgi:hypothetical protein
MMMVAVLASVCCLSSVGGGYYMYSRPTTTPAPTVGSTLSPADQALADAEAKKAELLASGGGTNEVTGRRTIKYGNVGLVVPANSKCNSKAPVYFESTQENDQHIWNLDPVPNQDGLFYIRSEQRSFKSACPSYLTSPKGCKINADVTLEKGNYADRQYWKVIPSGEGYMLQSQACLNGRGPSYMVSKGATSGKKNTARLTSRAGSVYSMPEV